MNIFIWSQWLWSYGGRYFDEKMRPFLNSLEAIKATEKYAELLKKFGPKGFEDITHHDIVYTQFSQGKLGMFIDASVWVSVLNDPTKSKVVGNWIESTFEDAKIARIDYRPFQLPEWVQIGDILGIAVQDAIAGKKGAKEALDEANQKITDLMKKAGYF